MAELRITFLHGLLARSRAGSCGYHLSWRRDDGEALRLDEALASGERIFVVFWHSNTSR